MPYGVKLPGRAPPPWPPWRELVRIALLTAVGFVSLVGLLMLAYENDWVPIRVVDEVPANVSCDDGRVVIVEARRILKPRDYHPTRQALVDRRWVVCKRPDCVDVASQVCDR